jgi:hypothetical protein
MREYFRNDVLQLPKTSRKVRVAKATDVIGLPTVGHVLATNIEAISVDPYTSEGIYYLLYHHNMDNITTLITFEDKKLHVSVIGGDEEVRRRWLNYLRVFNAGLSRKRGRPKKTTTNPTSDNPPTK